jgi:O-antigen/teichoic acid export membrane protein
MVDFGLSSATARYLSKYNAEGKREEAEKFLGAVYKLYLIVDAVIMTALVIIYFRIDSIYATLTPDELSRFKVVYIISALFSVTNFPFVTFNGILTSHEKFVPLKLSDVLYRVFLVGFTILALLMGFGLYALVTVHAIVGLSVTLFKFIVIKKTVPLKVNFRHKDKSLYKDIFGFSIWTTISSLMQRLVFNITPSILGMVTGAAQIAVFGIVTTIEGYSYTITTAINGMFMPKISRLVANDKSEKALNKLLVDVGKFQFALNKPLENILDGLDIIHQNTAGSITTIVTRNSKEEVESLLAEHSPLLFEEIPLKLEEVFVYEMEAKGYGKYED